MAQQNGIAAVGYARRSTDMQERSIPDQQTHVERWAAENGCRVLRWCWYVDDAISGTSTKGRDAFESMIREAENGRDFDAVLCYDMSRFSRGGTNETGYYLHRLTLAGVKAVFTAEGIPEGDEGELLQGVKSWQARQFSVKLARDVIRGQLSSLKQNPSAQGGRAPYGYDRRYLAADGTVLRTIRFLPDGRKQEFDAQGRHVRLIAREERPGKTKSDVVRFVPGDPAHVAIVRETFGRCIEGYGYWSIASDLNKRGVPGPKGNPWSEMMVKMVLHNPVYRGALAWNRMTVGKISGFDGEGRLRPKKGRIAKANDPSDWIVIEDAHEPLVDTETFERAQRVLDGRRSQGGLARPTNRYLLSSLMRCTKCGHTFWGCTGTHHYSKKKTRFYKDGGYQTHGRAVCLHTMIDADALDAWVLRQLRVVVLGDADTAERAIDAFVRDAMGGRDDGEDRAGVQKELAAVSKRIKATVGLLGNAELGGMAELEQALVDLQRQRKELEARLAGCDAPASPAPSEKEVRAWAKEKIEALGAAVAGRLPPMELRNVVSGYVDRIEVDPVAKTGTMCLPGDALACLEADAIRRVKNGSHEEQQTTAEERLPKKGDAQSKSGLSGH